MSKRQAYAMSRRSRPDMSSRRATKFVRQTMKRRMTKTLDARLKQLSQNDWSSGTDVHNRAIKNRPKRRWSQLDMVALDEDAFKEAVSGWNFPIFKAFDASKGYPLSLVATLTFSSWGFGRDASLSSDGDALERAYANFILNVEKGYRSDIPYHTATHAADVMQTVNAFLSDPALKSILSPLEQLSALTAAAIHDLGHPGKNNAFQIATKSPLATTYNDRSVLEAMHVAKAFQIIRTDSSCDFLSFLNGVDSEATARAIIINSVLGTDMAQHFESLSYFKTSILNNDQLDIGEDETRQKVIKMALHCADVSNPSKDWKLYSTWTERCMEEFFCQGDEERERGLKISPFMDRQNPTIAKCQVGFINFIVKPLFSAWTQMLPGLKTTIMRNIETNMQKWVAKQDEFERAQTPASVPAFSHLESVTENDDEDEEEEEEEEEEEQVVGCESIFLAQALAKGLKIKTKTKTKPQQCCQNLLPPQSFLLKHAFT